MALDLSPDPEGDEDHHVKDVDLQAKVLALENDLGAAKRELATRVKHYESKLVTMTVINGALQNENEKLKDEVAKIQEVALIDQDVAELQEEYTKRLGSAERTASNMNEECCTLKQQVEALKKGKELVAQELGLKQSLVEQYVTEGQKLSIKIGELESIIKRCRAELSKAEQDKQKLLSRVQILEVAAKEYELNRSLGVAESNQVIRQLQQECEETRMQAEKDLQSIREEGEAEISCLSQQINEREKVWAANLDALRRSLTQASQTASDREDSLREEMKRLVDRCRTAEAAQEEATACLSEATLPFVRQLSQREALMEQRDQKQAYELQELQAASKSTRDSLLKAEAGAAAAEERAEAAEIIANRLRADSQAALLELQKSEKEKQELRDKLVATEEKLATAEKTLEELNEKLLQAEEIVATAEKAQEEAVEHFVVEQAAKEEAERLLEEAKLELQAEADGIRQQFQSLKTSLAEQEREFRARMTSLRSASLAENDVDSTSSGSTNSTLRASPVSSSKELPIKSSPEFLTDINELDLSKGGLPPNPVNMERLASEVRRLQGEVAQLHKDMKAAQSACDHASEDLLKARETVNTLEKDSASASKVRKELEELKKRHEMALVIIGEQNEKSEELEADIYDVRMLYREQMNLLISQIDPEKWPDGYRICLFCSHCAQVQRHAKHGTVK